MLPMWIITRCLLIMIVGCSVPTTVTAQPTNTISAVKIGNDNDMIVELKEELSQMKQAVQEMVIAINDVNKPTPMSSTDDCPTNFTFISTVNRCYRFVNAVSEWVTADLLCKQFNKKAHLAFVTSMDDQNAIRKVITGLQCPSDTWWIGGQRIDPSYRSTFVWKSLAPDGTSCGRIEPIVFTDWWRDDPNFSGPIPESCMALWHRDRSLQYQWVDGPCTALHCFICEVDLTPQPTN